jgi:hypothetical protein
VSTGTEPIYWNGRPLNTIDVDNEQAFFEAIQWHTSQGFNVLHSDGTCAVLERPKKKMSGATKIIASLTVLPYVIAKGSYNLARNADRTVAIRIRESASHEGETTRASGVGTMSPDLQYWWNGSQWVDADASTPPGAKRNDDGSLWWDGRKWRAVR